MNTGGNKKMTENNIEIINKVSDFYKIVSVPSRLKIIATLDEKELNVSDLCNEVEMTQSAISHQLAILKQFNIVKSRKQGKEVYYSLADSHIKDLIELIITHIREENL
jgi:ArsR family transcriptional regulator